MGKIKTYEENIKIAVNYDWNTGVDMLRNINKDQIDESKTENVYFDESSQVRYVKTFDEVGHLLSEIEYYKNGFKRCETLYEPVEGYWKFKTGGLGFSVLGDGWSHNYGRGFKVAKNKKFYKYVVLNYRDDGQTWLVQLFNSTRQTYLYKLDYDGLKLKLIESHKIDEKGNYKLHGIQQRFKENGEIESIVEYDKGVKVKKE